MFLIWSILLSGLLNSWTHSPGVIQALDLTVAQRNRDAQIARVEAQNRDIRTQIDQILTNPEVQEKLIREELGMVAEDEIIFDFSSPKRQEPHSPF